MHFQYSKIVCWVLLNIGSVMNWYWCCGDYCTHQSQSQCWSVFNLFLSIIFNFSITAVPLCLIRKYCDNSQSPVTHWNIILTDDSGRIWAYFYLKWKGRWVAKVSTNYSLSVTAKGRFTIFVPCLWLAIVHQSFVVIGWELNLK